MIYVVDEIRSIVSAWIVKLARDKNQTEHQTIYKQDTNQRYTMRSIAPNGLHCKSQTHRPIVLITKKPYKMITRKQIVHTYF